jgi:hypothetical protein
MVHLPYRQPFEDVNKPVSRLAANIPLIRHNLCPLSFIDVPQQAYVEGMVGIYELNRMGIIAGCICLGLRKIMSAICCSSTALSAARYV